MKDYLWVSILSAIMLFTFNGNVWAINDSEALSLIATIDQNEIDAAQDAISKNSTNDVVNFARTMNKEHSANLSKAQSIAQKTGNSIQETDAVKNLRNKGQHDLDTLKPLSGEEYSKVYIKSMVKGHTEALDLIDNQLKPNVQNKDVQNFIEETRHHVDMHLKMAKKIQLVHE
jgi:predicted outer membrane protein